MENKEIIADAIRFSQFVDLPIRIYIDGKLVAYESPQWFAKDYADVFLGEIMDTDMPAGYLLTEEGMYFCFAKNKERVMIIGPASNSRLSVRQANKIADIVGCSSDEREQYCANILKLRNIPIYTVLYMCCLAYYWSSGKYLVTSDIYKKNRLLSPKCEANVPFKEISFSTLDDTTSLYEEVYKLEKCLTEAVKYGDVNRVEEIISNLDFLTTRSNKNRLRSNKNVFIAFLTLVSRAAIEGGMSVVEVYSLAEEFGNRLENVANLGQLSVLQKEMIERYTDSVSSLLLHIETSEIVEIVFDYIQEHISEKITVTKMAEDFGMSRNTLSSKFTQSTGYNLSEYIMVQKIERAKYLITSTDFSLADISAYLAYSTQSHLQRAFKKHTGMTPNEYRKKYNRR